MLNLKLLWPEVGAYTTVKFVAAGLGDDLHHTARRLAVLRLVATRLYIDFLDERDVDAIGHVLIFQPAASCNGGVGRTCPPTVIHSRSPIDQAADIASNWQLVIKGIVQVRSESCGRSIDPCRCRRNLDGLGYRTRLKRDGNRRGSVREHFDLFYVHSFEAGLLCLSGIITRHQEVEHKATLRVGHRCHVASRAGKRDLRFWHDRASRIHDRSAEVALNGRLLGEQTNTEKQN